jgi:hypothetical protein
LIREGYPVRDFRDSNLTSMKFSEVVSSIGRVTDLKRFASAYVIDFRNLEPEEIRAALLKTGPQYFHRENVLKAFRSLDFSEDRELRTLAPIILRRVLLQKDGFVCSVRETEDSVIEWEQGIIDASNEAKINSKGEKQDHLNLLRFVVETAWEQNDSVSVDEKNLIEKLRERLKLSEIEYRIIEADLGKFPKPGNNLHSRSEIEDARRALQSAGLIAAIKDNSGVDYDVIPLETAEALRWVLGLEVRSHGFGELLGNKYVKQKAYLLTLLQKCEIPTDGLVSSDDIRREVMEHIKPSVVLGGLTPKDGLSMTDLSKWCEDLKLATSGLKADKIARIVAFYDNLHEKEESVGDEREIWYSNFEAFANRDLQFLRSQQLITKDLEVERRFEAATNFLFERKLGHKPLKLIGTAHADGVLSHGDSLIYWDNKSKECEVSLKDHLKQFDGYVREAEKPLTCFLVIGPKFTDDSQALAMQYKVQNGTSITLITAGELKTIADKWAALQSSGSEKSFPLGYFEQTGRFNPALLPL